MISKLYDKIKKFISENIIFLTIIMITYMICMIPFPYYINAPGGVIDISNRVEVKNQTESKGSLNLAYVKEYKATIPTLVFSYFKSDWDILEKEEVLYENETMEDASFRNHISLEEANQNAIFVAMREANRKVNITSRNLYITYIDPKADTDLKVQDEILSIDGKKIGSKHELIETLKAYQVNDVVTLEVMRNKKKITAQATLYQEEERVMIGVVISEIKKIKNDDVTFHFKKEESGPSGGFMMSLAIYNALVKEDLTHGLTIVGTGTIDENGTVGSIGGVTYKLKGAVKAKADLFFVPSGENYDEAMKVKKENHYDIKIVKISTFQDALHYLKQLP